MHKKLFLKKTLIEVCIPHLYASFGKICVEIGQLFVAQWSPLASIVASRGLLKLHQLLLKKSTDMTSLSWLILVIFKIGIDSLAYFILISGERRPLCKVEFLRLYCPESCLSGGWNSRKRDPLFYWERFLMSSACLSIIQMNQKTRKETHNFQI